MPPKMRELRSKLQRCGFIQLQGKGRHEKWYHAKSKVLIVLSGSDGSNAKPYTIKIIDDAIKSVKS
jgi:predicted RNA binding protein YcfA (HicA-like mRNA interferase family)